MDMACCHLLARPQADISLTTSATSPSSASPARGPPLRRRRRRFEPRLGAPAASPPSSRSRSTGSRRARPAGGREGAAAAEVAGRSRAGRGAVGRIAARAGHARRCEELAGSRPVRGQSLQSFLGADGTPVAFFFNGIFCGIVPRTGLPRTSPRAARHAARHLHGPDGLPPLSRPLLSTCPPTPCGQFSQKCTSKGI